MTTRLVIFDCDGTLVDSQHDIVAAMQHAFACVDLPAPTRAQTLSIVGLSVPEAIAVLAPEKSEAVRKAIIREFRSGTPHQQSPGGRVHVLYPGALEAVTALAARDDIVLGIATGKSHRGVHRLFDHYDWHRHFATIQTADNNPSKPHPGMIESAMAATGIGAARTIMIGDTSFDMARARAANVTALGVSWGYHPVGGITRAGAHAIADTFDQLLALIDKPCA